MCAGLLYMGMPAPCTQRCACPLPCSAQTQLHSALCSTDYSILFRTAPMKCFLLLFLLFFQVNEGQLILFGFPKEVSTSQKLVVFLFFG